MTVNKDEIRRLDAAKLLEYLQCDGIYSFLEAEIERGTFDVSPDAKEETIRQQDELIEKSHVAIEEMASQILALEGRLLESDVQKKQQAEEIESLRGSLDEWRADYGAARQQLRESEEARKAAERDNQTLQKALQVYADECTALRECLKEIADSKRDMSGVLARVSARKVLAELDRKDTQPEEFLIELECEHEVQTQRGEYTWTCDSCGVVVEDTQGEGGHEG